MIPESVFIFDKGYQSHFPDLSSDEKILVYCVAYAAPVGSIKNSEYWCLITDKKFRLVRRKNSLMGLLSSDDNCCIDMGSLLAKDAKFALNYRIQFYLDGSSPQKARSPTAFNSGLIGAIIYAATDRSDGSAILLHFKHEVYLQILDCFKELGRLT